MDCKEARCTSRYFSKVLPIISVSDFIVYFGLLFHPWFMVKFLLERPQHISAEASSKGKSFLRRPESSRRRQWAPEAGMGGIGGFLEAPQRSPEPAGGRGSQALGLGWW